MFSSKKRDTKSLGLFLFDCFLANLKGLSRDSDFAGLKTVRSAPRVVPECFKNPSFHFCIKVN